MQERKWEPKVLAKGVTGWRAVYPVAKAVEKPLQTDLHRPIWVAQAEEGGAVEGPDGKGQTIEQAKATASQPRQTPGELETVVRETEARLIATDSQMHLFHLLLGRRWPKLV